MPNRFQIRQHDLAYRFIAARDGEHCLICRRKPPGVQLQIDHADGNEQNWAPDNLHLLCQFDNLQLRGKPPREHRRLLSFYSAKNVCVRERERGIESTDTSKELVDYSTGSQEMKANSIYERRFRRWLLEEIARVGSIPKKEVINSGAEMAGCNPVTISRYLDKLTSAISVLKEAKDAFGNIIITYKRAKKG